MNDALALSGGCLCGSVRYEARPESRDGYYCHCRMCQLAFGNTRAAFLNLRKDQMRWTARPPTYYASSKIARRGFCAQCGTPLSFEYLDSDRMDLAVGSFDEPGRLKPTSHFAVETRIPEWHVPDGLAGHPLTDNARITQRWRDAYGADVAPGVEAVRRGGQAG